MSLRWLGVVWMMIFAAALSGCQTEHRAEGKVAEEMGNRADYSLLKETALEIQVSVIQGQEPGTVIYLVGGVHGDEIAGWQAANQLKESSLTKGMLYILSTANRYGAEHHQRRTKEERDLNRNFPGDAKGCDAEQIAAAIYQDIEEKQPDLVLDLHEAVMEREDRDFLGNSLICQSLEKSGDLVLELLERSSEGTLASGNLALYGSPPPGSLNRVVTEQLGIPVITVETYREDELETRIKNHMDIAGYVLHYYEMQ